MTMILHVLPCCRSCLAGHKPEQSACIFMFIIQIASCAGHRCPESPLAGDMIGQQNNAVQSGEGRGQSIKCRALCHSGS